MATIVNNPDTGSGGWAVAVVLLVVVALVALFVWPGYVRQTAAPTTTQAPTEVNVQIPTPNVGAGGGTAEPAQ